MKLSGYHRPTKKVPFCDIFKMTHPHKYPSMYPLLALGKRIYRKRDTNRI